MLDIECFSFLNRALEDEMAPVVRFNSNLNRGPRLFKRKLCEIKPNINLQVM